VSDLKKTGDFMFNPPIKLRHVALVLLLGNVLTVQAAQELHNFNLPAQELSTTLDQLAQSGQTKLIYADKTVQGLQAAPVQGQYTIAQALSVALGKTDLGYEVVDNKLITVKNEKKETAKAVGDSEPTVLETVNVTDKANRGANDPYNKDYTRSYSSTATKTDTPIMETPLNIQVIPKVVLDDQQAVKIDQAVKYVSGVTTGQGAGGLTDQITIRGFYNYNLFRNGFRIDATGSEGTRNMANIQSLEVLKGPAAMLYGRVEPGGMLNLVHHTED
jgi:iron complex outermembrane receptor protein